MPGKQMERHVMNVSLGFFTVLMLTILSVHVYLRYHEQGVSHVCAPLCGTAEIHIP